MTPSTAASTTGRYSGRQPAITLLTATFSTVAGAHLGGTCPMTSWGSRRAPASMRSTRSRVGGTMGNPSLSFRSRNQSLAASRESSTSMTSETSVTPEPGFACDVWAAIRERSADGP